MCMFLGRTEGTQRVRRNRVSRDERSFHISKICGQVIIIEFDISVRYQSIIKQEISFNISTTNSYSGWPSCTELLESGLR